MAWRHDHAGAHSAADQDDWGERSREACAQAESLRLDLAQARARLDKLEAELWAVTLRSCSAPHDHPRPASATDLIVPGRQPARCSSTRSPKMPREPEPSTICVWQRWPSTFSSGSD